ncbi:MAG: HmuY family protein [Candidatus Kapabacteria bacterium]|nr:HmuY family protein [Candidatus Kapabacteria bacterium]
MPEDTPVTPFNRGSERIAVAEMGSDYLYQIYFNLDKDSVVKQNLYPIWDLAFSCDEDHFHIYLNSARFMRAYDFGEVDFNSINLKKIINIPETSWKHDKPDGTFDSTAIGVWWIFKNDSIFSKNHTYVIDRGFDEKKNSGGYKKLTFLGFSRNSYILKIANPDGSSEKIIEVAKHPNRNHIFLNFDDGGKILDLEPDNRDWDLQFTRFTELLADNAGNPMWYLVTTVLINTKNVRAGLLTTKKDFSEVSIEDTSSVKLSNIRTSIGYDWKGYDFVGTNTYTVYPEKIYIIQDSKGFYWKLHFIDFFNDKGEKGYPKFEYKKL